MELYDIAYSTTLESNKSLMPKTGGFSFSIVPRPDLLLR